MVMFCLFCVWQETLVPQADHGDTEMVCTWQGKNLSRLLLMTLSGSIALLALVGLSIQVPLYLQQEAMTGSLTLQCSPPTWVKLSRRRRLPLNCLRTADSPDTRPCLSWCYTRPKTFQQVRPTHFYFSGCIEESNLKTQKFKISMFVNCRGMF